MLHHLVLGHSGKKDDHSLKVISEHKLVLMQKFSWVMIVLPGHGRKEEPTERTCELLLLARKL